MIYSNHANFIHMMAANWAQHYTQANFRPGEVGVTKFLPPNKVGANVRLVIYQTCLSSKQLAQKS